MRNELICLFITLPRLIAEVVENWRCIILYICLYCLLAEIEDEKFSEKLFRHRGRLALLQRENFLVFLYV